MATRKARRRAAGRERDIRHLREWAGAGRTRSAAEWRCLRQDRAGTLVGGDRLESLCYRQAGKPVPRGKPPAGLEPATCRLQISRSDSQGLENKALADGNSLPTATGAVTGATIDDPRLAEIAAAWPNLPEAIRRAMRAMVE